MSEVFPDPKDEAQQQMASAAPLLGRYTHYKGGEYEVIGHALKEDTLEPLVIYRSLAHGTTWARTFEDWNQEVEVDGQRVKRFSGVKNDTIE